MNKMNSYNDSSIRKSLQPDISSKDSTINYDIFKEGNSIFHKNINNFADYIINKKINLDDNRIKDSKIDDKENNDSEDDDNDINNNDIGNIFQSKKIEITCDNCKKILKIYLNKVYNINLMCNCKEYKNKDSRYFMDNFKIKKKK